MTSPENFERLEAQLRQAMSDAAEPTDHDVAGLKERIHQRGTTLRRRRTAIRTAGVAVAGALAISAAVTVPDLLAAPPDDLLVGPAASTTTPDEDEQTSDDADGMLLSEPNPSVAVETTAPPPEPTDPSEPPYQPAEPAVVDPADVLGDPAENEWPIPDARTTAYSPLTSTPVRQMSYGPGLAVPGMTCDPSLVEDAGTTEDQRLAPAGVASWFHYADGTGADGQLAYQIIISGWDDGAAAFTAATETNSLTCAWSQEVWVPEPLIWPEPTDAEQVWVAELTDGEDAGTTVDSAVAVVALTRTGDYLVAVEASAMTGVDVQEALEAATVIADQTTANLAFLDAERTGD